MGLVNILHDSIVEDLMCDQSQDKQRLFFKWRLKDESAEQNMLLQSISALIMQMLTQHQENIQNLSDRTDVLSICSSSDLVLEDEADDHCNPDAFDENTHRIDEMKPASSPNQDMILEFCARVWTLGTLSPQIVVQAIHYLCKIHQSLPLTPCNWKNLLLGCLVISSKMQFEDSIYISDFLDPDFFPYLTTQHLQNLEFHVLQQLEYSLEFEPNDYRDVLLNLAPLMG